uniref:Si:ch211-156j22.4 n=1 Tax=Cyprinus carpio TaxID=7962 RepID=A0A8C2CHB0_CYPCA
MSRHCTPVEMPSPNTLRPQNRSQRDHAGILKHQELKTKSASSKRGSENLDPSASPETGKGVSKLKGVSRLPVLAKSLQPALNELSQNPSYNRWEQRALTSKAQKKRICTKPVPFNLSHSRTHNQRETAIPLGKAALATSTRLTPGAKVRNLNQSAKTETSSNKAMTASVLRAQANKSHQLQPGSHVEYVASNKDSSDVHPPSHESGCCSHTDLSSRLGSITLGQSKIPEDSGLSHLCKTSLSKVDVDSDNQAPKDKYCLPTTTTQSHVNTKAVHNVLPCEGSSAVGAQCMMPRVSTCPPGPGTFNNLPQRVVKKSHGVDVIADKAGLFYPDSLALRSILQSDGMSLGEHVGSTPRVSTCPTGRGTSIYSAQRVPAKKTQKEAPAEAKSPTRSAFSPDPSALRGILQISGTTPHAPTGLTGRATSVYSAQRVPVRKPQTDDSAAVKVSAGNGVSFSPDPAALHSILLYEGVRAGGATPRVSTCPTGRGTSIYSAQRVPVTKNKPEVVAAATSSQCANRTPVMKWTPQRIANTKPQSMRKLCTAQKMSSLRGSPGLHEAHNPSTGLLVCQKREDVVQRLFEDQEQMDDDQIDQDDITSQQLLNSHQTPEAQSTIKENSDSKSCHTKNEGKKTAQPFIQAAHRGSVIVFSSSQRLSDTLKTPGTGDPLQLFDSQLTSHNALLLQSDQSNGSQINPSLDLPKQSQSKAPIVMHSTTVSALRRRHNPLEEMFLDEECATYTSRLLSCPLQPRCGNPVAATLLFQDSTCFLPIGLSSPVRLSLVPSGSSIRA